MLYYMVQERARFAGCKESDQLYHSKLHLDNSALNVFRMLPASEKLKVESVINALKKQLQSAFNDYYRACKLVRILFFIVKGRNSNTSKEQMIANF